MNQDKMNNTMSMFCISSPMPVKMLSSLKKAKLPEVGLGPQLGEKYQAELPALLSNKEKHRDFVTSKDREGLRLWPGRSALDGKEEMERYLEMSRELKYNSEQALALLYWHKMDVAAAQADLANFTPRPDSWSPQEKTAFADALRIHGKDFSKLKIAVPSQPMKELVRYYYSRERNIQEIQKIERKAVRISPNTRFMRI